MRGIEVKDLEAGWKAADDKIRRCTAALESQAAIVAVMASDSDGQLMKKSAVSPAQAEAEVEVKAITIMIISPNLPIWAATRYRYHTRRAATRLPLSLPLDSELQVIKDLSLTDREASLTDPDIAQSFRGITHAAWGIKRLPNST